MTVAIKKASHDLSAKPLAWCLRTLLGLEQLLITVLVVIDIQMEWSHITPSCLKQVLTIVHVKLASLKVQDKVVKHKAATNKHEGPFLVFYRTKLDGEAVELTKCLKSTFEQPYCILSTYLDLYS